jgi:hypothetical protein
MAHKCNSAYCSKCHKDRIYDARAAGYKAGVLAGLREAAEQHDRKAPIEQAGSPYRLYLETLMDHVERTGELSEEEA